MSYFKKDFMYYVKKSPVALWYIFIISIVIFLFLLPFSAPFIVYDMYGFYPSIYAGMFSFLLINVVAATSF